MVQMGDNTKHNQEWAADSGRPFRTLRWLGLAAAVLALAAMSGDRQAWGAASWTVGQRAVVAAALRSTVPPELALAVARVSREERLRGEGAPGAVGIMQVRPSLAHEELGIKAYGLEDGRANAGAGVTLLERLNRRYDGRWDLTLSHYRRGPLFRCKEGPVMHDGTLKYVAEVMDWWVRYQKDAGVVRLMEDVRSDGYSENGVSSRVDGDGRAPGANARHGRWRPFGERWNSARDDGCNGSARGRSQFRSDDRPTCDGVRSRRFF